MTRSHRNEDRGGEHRWTFNGVEYPTRKLMCEARRAEYVRLLDEEGMNFTQAAHAVGVSKRTGKAWRNGRTRATGRNEKPLVDWYRSTMDKPKTLHPRYLSQEERIQIACFASMFVRQVRQCFSVVWADGFPRCRHRFPVM